MQKTYKTPLAQRVAAKAYYEARRDDPEYRETNRARARARRVRAVAEGTVQEWDRNAHLSKRYGITLVEWEEMFNRQGRCCAICRSSDPRRKSGGWATDHDPKTGKVRGVLCSPCNKGLGCFLDEPEVLRAAILYLEAQR